MAIETLNMKTVSLSRVIKQIKFQLVNEDYTPVVVIGKSGVGKTESMADLAKELNIGFVELRLSHYQESDLIGLPYITSDNRTSHAMTELFPDIELPITDPTWIVMIKGKEYCYLTKLHLLRNQ